MRKIAVVLLNMGGPDSLENVRPFLFNMFNDPAIIGLPRVFRFLAAGILSKLREKKAKEIYAKIGGGSPILKNTYKQAEALSAALGNGEFRVFVAMRYAAPFAKETVAEVLKYAPDEVVLLPLYPQFSGTTTQSSFDDWFAAAGSGGLLAPTKVVRSYAVEEGFVRAISRLISEAYKKAEMFGRPRILFSAHGLPKRIVEAGDDYPRQCSETVDAVVRGLGRKDLDFILCFQSRVGPVEWIPPFTDDEIVRAGRDRAPVILVPMSFVSEHAETLVEMDMEYADLAGKSGVPCFIRVPTVGIHGDFIAGLVKMVNEVVG